VTSSRSAWREAESGIGGALLARGRDRPRNAAAACISVPLRRSLRWQRETYPAIARQAKRDQTDIHFSRIRQMQAQLIDVLSFNRKKLTLYVDVEGLCCRACRVEVGRTRPAVRGSVRSSCWRTLAGDAHLVQMDGRAISTARSGEYGLPAALSCMRMTR